MAERSEDSASQRMNHGATSKRANRKSKQNGIKSFCSENLLKLRVSIYEKGSQVYIEGKLKTRKWTDDAGVERYTTEIIVSQWRHHAK